MKKAKLIFDEQQVKEQIYRTRKLKCKKISKNFIIFRFEERLQTEMITIQIINVV